MACRLQITGILLFIVLGTSACTHRVGFQPLRPLEVSPSIDTAVSVYVDPQVLEASYVYKTTPYKWIIPYGPRLREFIELYFGTAFADYRLIGPPVGALPDHLVVDLHDIEYRFVAQHAYVEIVATAFLQGKQLSAKTYSSEGLSGIGAVLAGGEFAQKGVVRSSTDDVFNKIFSKMIGDLRAALSATSEGSRSQEGSGG